MRCCSTGPARENISIGAPYADDSAIVQAEEAGLTQFVNRHPQGFDMLIGERGESLSGGQRQGSHCRAVPDGSADPADG